MNPTLKLSTLDEQKISSPLSWAYQIQPLWKVNAEGGTQFYWQVDLEIPDSRAITQTQLQKSKEVLLAPSTPTEGVHQKLTLYLEALTDELTLTFSTGEQKIIQMELLFPSPWLVGTNCESSTLFLKRVAVVGPTSLEEATPEPKTLKKKMKPVPFYLSYNCEALETGTKLSVTVPQEVSWLSSSVFESKGKNQSWKNFELNLQMGTDNLTTIGTMDLQYQNELFRYQIRIAPKTRNTNLSAFRFALGLMDLTLKNKSTQDHLVKPASLVTLELRPFNNPYVIGGEGLTSLPSVNLSSYYSHTESMGFLGYTYSNSENWRLEPRLYLYLADGSNKKMSYFYVSSLPALGGLAQYHWSEQNSITLELLFMALADQSILSNRFFYSHRNPKEPSGWGVVLIFQSLGMNRLSTKPTTGTETFLGAYLEY